MARLGTVTLVTTVTILALASIDAHISTILRARRSRFRPKLHTFFERQVECEPWLDVEPARVLDRSIRVPIFPHGRGF